MLKKRIAILGSTGSIGTQALEVIENNPDHFELEVITAQANAKLLIEQAIKFKPNAVVIGNEERYQEVSKALEPHYIKVFAGKQALNQIVELDSIDLVLVALVGFSGLEPTLNAIAHKKVIALANKETLVVGGDLVTRAAAENRVPIIPVDSEHSAIFQCLAGELNNPIEKVILTASGGPFRGMGKGDLVGVTTEEALQHPNWNMGCKVTIDSATLMNKGLEVIEAKWLFNLKPDQIEVIVHPQSIIHSIVQFRDGSMKAQMGLPDMKLPIQYALSYPLRLHSDFPRFNFANFPALTFEQADIKNFRNLALAFEALERGGNVPCILNAANEIAVSQFLKKRIGFMHIPEIIEQSMDSIAFIAKPDLDNYLETDTESRKLALNLIKKL